MADQPAGAAGAAFEFDGRPIEAGPGQTVAAALWQAGVRSWRSTAGGPTRGLFCGIGACYGCLATIDGRPDQRTCLAPAADATVVSGTPRFAHPPVGAPPAPSDPGGTPRFARRPVGAPPAPPGRGTVRYDVAVVGAGPAGLAAAATAGLAGARVALVDSAPRVGGQFWRRRPGPNETGGSFPGGSCSAGSGVDGVRGAGRDRRHWSLFEGLRSIVEERVDHIAGAAVWFVEPGFTLHTSAGRVEADRIVLATGAHDRTLPFPGWDLPGVITPGAAQALLKGSGVLAGGEVVVAGAGPFLLPVAVGLADAGARVLRVVEAGDPRRYLRRPSVVAGVLGRLGEAAGYAAVLARRRIPYRIGCAVVAAHGTAGAGVAAVDIARLDRSGRAVEPPERVGCDAVAVGYGFTANLDLALSLGCATRLGADGGLALVVGDDGQTSVPGVYAAGEVTGVGGATLAVVEGELAGSAAAQSGGAPAALSGRELASLRRRRDRMRAFADLMHAAHSVPAGWPEWLDAGGSTLVCRCEEVRYAALRQAVLEWGATDARTVKLLARPGMGWCQGRVCGFAVAHLTARLCGRDVTAGDLAALARRPFAAPVLLGDLARHA